MQEISTTTVSFPTTGSRDALSEVLRTRLYRILTHPSNPHCSLSAEKVGASTPPYARGRPTGSGVFSDWPRTL
jgi:hypothetical protein